MRSDQNRQIEITEAAQLIGRELYNSEWTGSELERDPPEESAKARSAKVHSFIRTMIRDGRVRTWTVDERGDRWPLEKEIATDPLFGVYLHIGKVCGIWGPDSLSGCEFDRNEFLEYLGLGNTKNPGGRPRKHDWDAINNEIWRRIWNHGFDTVEKLAQEVADWCSTEFESVPDMADIRKRVRKVRDISLDDS